MVCTFETGPIVLNVIQISIVVRFCQRNRVLVVEDAEACKLVVAPLTIVGDLTRLIE